jgi:serine/threonine-protein kinase RsbT
MVTVLKHETLFLRVEDDIVRARQRVRQWAVQTGFTVVEQTKLVTAVSELARNTVVHGGGGQALMEEVKNSHQHGIRLTFTDCGPGIPDLALAMRDGYTSAKGLGLGLGGAKRLVSEFDIISTSGQGTTVRIVKWK